MKIDSSYIEDIIRELFDELHDFLVEDFIQHLSDKDKNNIKKIREKNRPFLGNFTQKDMEIIEDYTPKLFDSYSGEVPLKEIIRTFIDALYQYRTILSEHYLHNELGYALVPKLGRKKTRPDNIETFKEKLQSLYDLMGGGHYPQNEFTTPLMQEINKAYANVDKYLPLQKKTRKPQPKKDMEKWLRSLKLPNKNEVIKEFIAALPE